MSGSDRKVRKTLLTIGLGGTVLAVLCCVTPLLAVVLGALGLAAWLFSYPDPLSLAAAND